MVTSVLLIVTSIFLMAISLLLMVDSGYIKSLPKQINYRFNPMEQGMILLKQYGESGSDFESRVGKVVMDIGRSGRLISECTHPDKGYSQIEFSTVQDELDAMEKLKADALCLNIDTAGKSDAEIDGLLARAIAKIKASGHYLVQICGGEDSLLVYYQKCKAPSWWPEAPENRP